MVAEPHHLQSQPFQKCRPFGIVGNPVGRCVAVAIDLYNQSQSSTIEINDIWTKRTAGGSGAEGASGIGTTSAFPAQSCSNAFPALAELRRWCMFSMGSPTSTTPLSASLPSPLFHRGDRGGSGSCGISIPPTISSPVTLIQEAPVQRMMECTLSGTRLVRGSSSWCNGRLK